MWRHIPRADPHLLRQIAMVTRIGMGTLRHRLKGAMTVVVAMMVVTMVMNPLLILIDSFRAMMTAHTSALSVIVSQPGKRLENSHLPAAWADIIRQMPGIARARDGRPIIDARASLADCEHPERKSGDRGICVQLSGLETSGLALRPAGKLISGRFYRPRTHEIVMASYAAAQEGVKAGSRFVLSGQEWLVTGIFEPDMGWYRGASFGDAAIVRAASGTPDFNSTVRVLLASPGSFETFRAALAARSDIAVAVARESDFYRDFARGATSGWIIVCYVVGGLFSVGAGAGIFHLMQVTVEARGMEMAVLRAIGFGRAAVAASVVMEAALLAACGALLGLGVLWLWLDGMLYRGMLIIHVQPGRLAMVVGWALGVAVIGALAPALAAVRPEVAEALRT